jgi:hypothetical protein
VSLDRNATFPFKIHGIENLLFGLSGRDCTCGFEEPVSEG